MSTRRYVILTPFAKTSVLAGICKLHGLDVWVVPGEGAMVVRDLPVKEFDDWDISELLGEAAEKETDQEAEDQEPADNAHEVARQLAQLAREGVVLLQSELGDDVGDEAGVSGQVTAHAYVGDKVADTPAGLVVATGPQVLEDLLIGAVDPQDVEGAVRAFDLDETILEKLASKKPETNLPPKSPRRFFGGRR